MIQLVKHYEAVKEFLYLCSLLGLIECNTRDLAILTLALQYDEYHKNDSVIPYTT